MLTYRNTDVETIDRDNVNIGGHQIRCTWDASGAHVSTADLQCLRDDGLANWSDDEMRQLACHAENRMDETYTQAYDIVVYEGYNQDQIHVLESIRAINDAAANEYAVQHHDDHDWYVLDANGNNVNR